MSAAKADVFEKSISEIKDMLENGTLTSEILVQTYLERIEKYDRAGEKLNSIISINKNALAQAKQLDSERKAGKVRGALHGIPIVVKDNIDVSGFPTTMGKTSLVAAVKENDSSAVAALCKEGAIILGKTNMSTGDENARYTYSAVLGETRNAYNNEYASGGTSGGSAVSVSANFAAAALATDTNGSATYPAALNSVVALRPTHNLIDYTGAENTVKARDVISPMAKSVSDVALLMDVLTGKKEEGTYTKNLSHATLSGKTFAVLKELSQYTYNSPNEFKQSDKEVVALFENAKKIIEEKGGKVVEISIPKLFIYFNNCRENKVGSQNAKAALKAEIKNLIEQKGADAIIFPSYLSSPLKSGFDKFGSHNSTGAVYLNCGAYLPSLVGYPAISVPMGNVEGSVGAGLEIVMQENKDAELLALAYAFESAANLRKAPENLPNLYKVVERPSVPEQNEQQEEQKVPESQEEPSKQFKGLSENMQRILVAVIIAVVLALCIWALVYSQIKSRGKKIPKNRRF